MTLAFSQIGPYRIVALVGSGELAAVYRGQDTLYDRTVAVKVLHPHLAQDVRLARQVVNAGREAMRLRHPGIVRVYDAGQADGAVYVAMEWMEAASLAARLAARAEPWSHAATTALVEQVAAALDYAHRRGLVHHNLKPSNVFLDDEGRVWVSDFDCVPARGGEAGHPLFYRLQAPTYLAPEQARGDEVLDARADVYSLAALAYRLLTGQPPTAGGNPFNLLWRIAEETPPRADAIQSTVSREVADGLADALAKDASYRPTQVSDVVRGLRGEPVRRGGHGDPAWAPVVRPPAAEPEVTALPPRPAPVTAPRLSGRAVPPSEPEATDTAPRLESPAADEIPLAARWWEQATRSARRAEPMALPALALLAVGGLAALLLIIAAMRVAGTLMERMAADNRQSPGVIVVVDGLLPTVTPTPEGASNAVQVAAVAESARSEPVAAVPMAVVVTMAPSPVPPTPVPPTPVPTIMPTSTPSPVPPTATPTITATPAPTWTPTATATPTWTPTPLPTATPTATPTPPPTATPTRTPAPTAVGLTGRLAYTLWNPHTDRPDIWVWDLAARIHATPIANRRQPDFGPLGGMVANAAGGGMDNLVTMGVYGENPWLVSAHPEDAHPHWSSDGKKIVFDSAHMGDRQHRIYLQDDLARRDDRPPMMYLAWELFGRYPIFLADGRIAYNGCNYWDGGSVCGVYVVDTQGGMPSNASRWPGDVPTDNLGSRILFMSDRTGNWEMYSMNADGSDLRQLTNEPGIDGLGTASPDGNAIAFLTNRDGVWSFYVMGTDGGDVRKLFDLPGDFGRGDYDWLQERLSWGR